MTNSTKPNAATFFLAACVAAGACSAQAQTAASKPTAAVAAKGKTRAAAKKAAPEPIIAQASSEQLAAAERVYDGTYACEFDQVVRIEPSSKHAGYFDVAHKKSMWLMKPVASSTGAVRLEDVKGATLMVQIAAKSMLMDVKAGHRLVDECVSPKQHAAQEAAQVAREAASQAAAASAAR